MDSSHVLSVPSMRVFVSSTVYDLIDVRCEIDAFLRTLGISPVLSDNKLSEFRAQLDANSIETCLVNVESSDQVIVILNQRYGPRLGRYGFDDVSATHLEYRRANKCKKPIRFYVRDRLEADYAIWKNNAEKDDIEYSWIREQKDFGLFELLKEHRGLPTSQLDQSNNWVTTFTSSVDLKESLRRDLEPAIKPQAVVMAIYENRFPLFDVSLDADPITFGHIPSVKVQPRITNIGGAAAFNVRAWWQGRDEDSETRAIIVPGQSTSMTAVLPNDVLADELNTALFLRYDSVIGVGVCDEYRIRAFIQGGPAPVLISGAGLMKRTFSRTSSVTLDFTNL